MPHRVVFDRNGDMCAICSTVEEAEKWREFIREKVKEMEKEAREYRRKREMARK